MLQAQHDEDRGPNTSEGLSSRLRLQIIIIDNDDSATALSIIGRGIIGCGSALSLEEALSISAVSKRQFSTHDKLAFMAVD